jgi:hypothetical protein
MSTDDNVFHQHLDQCQQCREQPFNLCPIGARLLTEAATSELANEQYWFRLKMGLVFKPESD